MNAKQEIFCGCNTPFFGIERKLIRVLLSTFLSVFLCAQAWASPPKVPWIAETYAKLQGTLRELEKSSGASSHTLAISAERLFRNCESSALCVFHALTATDMRGQTHAVGEFSRHLAVMQIEESLPFLVDSVLAGGIETEIEVIRVRYYLSNEDNIVKHGYGALAYIDYAVLSSSHLYSESEAVRIARCYNRIYGMYRSEDCEVLVKSRLARFVGEPWCSSFADQNIASILKALSGDLSLQRLWVDYEGERRLSPAPPWSHAAQRQMRNFGGSEKQAILAIRNLGQLRSDLIRQASKCLELNFKAGVEPEKTSAYIKLLSSLQCEEAIPYLLDLEFGYVEIPNSDLDAVDLLSSYGESLLPHLFRRLKGSSHPVNESDVETYARVLQIALRSSDDHIKIARYYLQAERKRYANPAESDEITDVYGLIMKSLEQE